METSGSRIEGKAFMKAKTCILALATLGSTPSQVCASTAHSVRSTNYLSPDDAAL